MSEVAKRAWSQEEFFAWDGHSDGRYEFDGVAPVAMVGGSNRHSLLLRRLHRALERALDGRSCQPLGPDAGVETIGKAVRYPDGLITCSDPALEGDKYTVSDVVVVFEVISPSSGRVDRIVKVREYAAVPTIRRYVIVESAFPGLQVLARASGADGWSTSVLAAGDVLRMPEVGAEILVDALYEGVFSGN